MFKKSKPQSVATVGIGEASVYLKMRTDSLRRLANEGKIPCVRQVDACTPYGVRRFLRSDLDAYNAGKLARLTERLRLARSSVQNEGETAA